MTASRPTAFCPRCNQQVLLVRKQFETCLAIVLLLFTGIGFFIYLAVYYSKKEDRCVHCGTQITFSQAQVQYQPPRSRNILEDRNVITPSFCPLCGEKLNLGVKFCPNCGGKVTQD
ncbi:MAG: zinc-ribbon domain-containing protein [Promethearchaeota archaeon]|jgi:ribosomal protein S27AE